jgi:glycosyltransferase involved in cell wall biosynthesis
MATASVIIALYNKARYIARTVDSVLAQTFAEFELIIVDDGSTDGSGDIVRRYTDPRVRLIVQSNAGPGAARNTGMRQATSTLMAFLDADDIWLPTFLERSIASLQANPDCVMSVSGHARYSEPNRQRGVYSGPWAMSDAIGARQLVKFVGATPVGSVLCKKAIAEQYGGFYEKGHCTYGEDRYLWMQIVLNHVIYRIPDALLIIDDNASELSTGRTGNPPLGPILTEKASVFRNCPAQYYRVLRHCLGYYVVGHALWAAREGNFRSARQAFRLFPEGRDMGWLYVSAQIRIFCMPAALAVSQIRAILRQSPALLAVWRWCGAMTGALWCGYLRSYE